MEVVERGRVVVGKVRAGGVMVMVVMATEQVGGVKGLVAVVRVLATSGLETAEEARASVVEAMARAGKEEGAVTVA